MVVAASSAILAVLRGFIDQRTTTFDSSVCRTEAGKFGARGAVPNGHSAPVKDGSFPLPRSAMALGPKDRAANKLIES